MRVFRSLLLAALAASMPPAFGQPTAADVTLVASGLNQPVGIAVPPDGSPRVFAIQRSGAVRVITLSGNTGSLLATPFLNATTLIQGQGGVCTDTDGVVRTIGFTASGSEQGLLGMAFHPDFATNRRIFFSSSDGNGDSVIWRLTVDDPTANTAPALAASNCTAILRVAQDFTNHNGGKILFGPDGYLYFGLGDGGSGNDPCDRSLTLDPAALLNTSTCASKQSFTNPGGGAQVRRASTRALLGKMLRLDVDNVTPASVGTPPVASTLCASNLDGSANYAIPADNPFVGADPQNACDEVFIYGLRNPWQWSFDRANDDLYIGDVGQNAWEEINRVSFAAAFGANFDWKTCEGRFNRGSCTSTSACPASATSEVILAYSTSNACSSQGWTGGNLGNSVTGGIRYRGPSQHLQGVYFYGDAGNTNLRFSTESGGAWVQPASSISVTNLGGVILAFGEDPETGEVYVATAGGTSGVHRIGARGTPGLIFTDSFE
jgi:glucose/arabinose dehydrogenase